MRLDTFFIAALLLFGVRSLCAGGPRPPQVVKNSIGMDLVFIPAGQFEMGSPPGEKGRENDESLHTVKITRPFRIGASEVTQGQWNNVMKQQRGQREQDNLPITEVSWTEAVSFCKRLSKTEGKTYRLPTEAEWEYACRAGTDTPFNQPDKLSELAWFDDNGDGHPHAVGGKKPNAWGLYDTHGNVAEWCADSYRGRNRPHRPRGGQVARDPRRLVGLVRAGVPQRLAIGRAGGVSAQDGRVSGGA